MKRFFFIGNLAACIVENFLTLLVFGEQPLCKTHIAGGVNCSGQIISLRRFDKVSVEITSTFLISCHMDSNIPAKPAYGVYISQLVTYARICTSKVDFINRLRGLSLRLRQQGFETNLLQKSFNKFFSRHGLIVEKYGAALREMRLEIQA